MDDDFVRDIQIAAVATALYRDAAEEIARLAGAAAAARGRFTIALSGGTTPRGLYQLLATDARLRVAVPWERTQVFWSDERQVPPGHPDSNYRMADEALLSKVPVAEANVHRMRGELPDAAEAALRYEDELRAAFALAAEGPPALRSGAARSRRRRPHRLPLPGHHALREKRRAVAANWVDALHAWRITLTVPAINRARTVMFLVCGEGKAEAVRSVLEGGRESDSLPARLIHPESGRVLWFLDQAAIRPLRSKRCPNRYLIGG